jgi:hypothetical protein
MGRRSEHLEVIRIRGDDNVTPAQGPLHHAGVDNLGRAGARHERANQASLSVVERLNIAAD